MDKVFLPLGSVVRLKDATKRIMVTGFYIKPEDEDTIYDYVGCLYPEGIVSSKENLLFNHDQIEQIYHLGLVDEEEKKFKEDLNNAIKNSNNEE